MTRFPKQAALTVLFWLASSFCLGWVVIFWGKWVFPIALILVVAAGAAVRSVLIDSFSSTALAKQAAVDLLAIGLLSFGWVHVLIRLFMDI